MQTLIESPTLPPLGGLRALVAGVEALTAARRDGVLCVVVDTSGSSYRKPGALVLLDAAGVRVGALSGGCLEADLEARARDVLANGTAQSVRFDTSGDEDRVFGSGTGCGGSIEVLLLPLPASVAPLRRALRAADALDVELVLDLVGSGDRLGSGEARAGDECHRFDERGAPVDDDAFAADRHVRIAPAPRVLLLGAGPETRPLLVLTRLLGWRVELAEHRERWLRFAADSGVDAEYRDGPDGLAAVLAATRFDAALVMNHNLDLDARGLRALAATAIPYVGLLGPAARRDELLAEIGAARDALLPRLHAPVGLRLGGEGAEAIALAIVAELQQEFARAARAA
ncbi:MAG TPA: XdhC family protein [Dokdonella sp.]|nr:XdhC family protein [Dokdonella sp.]